MKLSESELTLNLHCFGHTIQLSTKSALHITHYIKKNWWTPGIENLTTSLAKLKMDKKKTFY
jgi:hypothetical protein